MHDSLITKYLVDFKNKTIDMEACDEQLLIRYVFHAENVLSHGFYHALEHNILFSVEECEISQFIKNYKEELEHGKAYHWPLMFQDIKQLEQILLDNQYHCIELSASYGLYGWILAKSYSIEKSPLWKA